MKKIIAIILAVCCLFAVVSCGNKNPDPTPTPTPTPDPNPTPDSGNTDPVDDVAKRIDDVSVMFLSLVPTHAKTTTTSTFGIVVLNTVQELTIGTVDGVDATKLVTVTELLSDVKGGGNLVITNTQELWYIEGRGTTSNKGRTWNAEGTDFAPVPGSISLNLAADYLAEKAYDAENEVLTLKVTAENAINVLGSFTPDSDISGDVIITIATAGGRISSIKIEYTVPEKTIDYVPDPEFPEDTEEMTVEEIKVVTVVEYDYDYQPITMG